MAHHLRRRAAIRADPGVVSNRRTGKIARLPKDLRDVVNFALRDGATYRSVLALLETHGQAGINEQNLTNWKEGGYQDWLKEQDRLADLTAQRDFAIEAVKASSGSPIPEAGLRVAGSQLLDVMSSFDLEKLKSALNEDPAAYMDLLNALAKISKGALDIERYRSTVSRAQTELQKLRAPKESLTEKDRQAIVDKVDEILGMK